MSSRSGSAAATSRTRPALRARWARSPLSVGPSVWARWPSRPRRGGHAGRHLGGGHVERRLGVKDPQIVCVDEVAGVLVTWIAAPPDDARPGRGLLAFRIFDQFKPWPAAPRERLGGGPGIMLDDVAAGLWGAAVCPRRRALGWL